MDSTDYSFKLKIATDYKSSDTAIMVRVLDSLIKVNRIAGENYHNGKIWTYNTAEGFAELLPWMNRRQVMRLLQKMESYGIIEIGNYNKTPFNRTQWHAFTDSFLKKYGKLLNAKGGATIQ